MASEISEISTGIDITGDGSVVKVVTKSGHGKEMPEIGDTCSVHYVGRVAGVKKPFDSSGSYNKTNHLALLHHHHHQMPNKRRILYSSSLNIHFSARIVMCARTYVKSKNTYSRTHT